MAECKEILSERMSELSLHKDDIPKTSITGSVNTHLSNYSEFPVETPLDESYLTYLDVKYYIHNDDFKLLLTTLTPLTFYSKQPKHAPSHLFAMLDIPNFITTKVFIPHFIKVCPLAKFLHENNSLVNNNHITIKYPFQDTPITKEMAYNYIFPVHVFNELMLFFVTKNYSPTLLNIPLHTLINGLVYFKYPAIPNMILHHHLTSTLSYQNWSKAIYAQHLHFYDDINARMQLFDHFEHYFIGNPKHLLVHLPENPDKHGMRNLGNIFALIKYSRRCYDRMRKRMQLSKSEYCTYCRAMLDKFNVVNQMREHVKSCNFIPNTCCFSYIHLSCLKQMKRDVIYECHVCKAIFQNGIFQLQRTYANRGKLLCTNFKNPVEFD